MKQSTTTRLGDVGSYVVFLLIGLFFIFPIFWSLTISLGTNEEIYTRGAKLLPEQITFENYERVLTFPFFTLYLWNALKLALLSAIGASLICLPSAYAFSRFKWRGREAAMISILVFKMLSGIIILVPLYRYLRELGLLDSHATVICVMIGTQIPMTVWLLKGFVDKVPRSLEQAAMIDGCTRVGAVFRVVLPALLPGFMASFIINLIQNWGSFIIPFILLSDPRLMPISVGLLRFQGDYEGSSQALVAAASIMSILPAIIAFVLLQRLIITSMTAGAVKG